MSLDAIANRNVPVKCADQTAFDDARTAVVERQGARGIYRLGASLSACRCSGALVWSCMGPAGGFIAWGLHSVPVAGVAMHRCGATWGLLGALSPGGFTQCLLV